jgi:hypothetical protein
LCRKEPSRMRWLLRLSESSKPGHRRSSSSRTCTGRTRPPLTFSGCWVGGSTRFPHLSLRPIETTSSKPTIRFGSFSASSWPARQSVPSRSNRSPRPRSPSSPSRVGSTSRSSTERRPGTRSSSPRRSPREGRRSPTRSGPPCWRAPRASGPIQRG